MYHLRSPESLYGREGESRLVTPYTRKSSILIVHVISPIFLESKHGK